MSSIHIPVLLNETIDVLLEGGGKTYIDCTVGTGGHSIELLSQTSRDVILFGIDKDEQSLEVAKDRLKAFEKRITLLQGGYEHLDELIKPYNPGPIAGIMFDAGMSSFQLDKASRGFSFREEGPLDMRFDMSQDVTAREIVNTLSQQEMRSIFEKFGEEKWSRRLSRVIVEKREEQAFKTTVDLSDFIRRNIPRRVAHKTLARVFQAIRILVNNELENLKEGLLKAFKLLDVGGRITLITYHSLEDKIAENLFRTLKKAGLLVMVNPKSARPSKTERMKNRRSRSARLRVIKKLSRITDEMSEEEIEELEEETWLEAKEND